MKKVKTLAQSETRIIKRSGIAFFPKNPKRHTEERIKLQKKNLQKVGFLGGIVWNEQTGNLIDGHRRIQAMDLYYEYDGTEATDYDIKVEVVRLDEAQEKQQVAYMAAGDTSYDIDLLADFADEIDLGEIGLSESEINDILNFTASVSDETPDILSDIIAPEHDKGKGSEDYQKGYEDAKDGKRRTKEIAARDQGNAESVAKLSFDNFENKMAFYDLMGANPNDEYIKGEAVLEMFS